MWLATPSEYMYGRKPDMKLILNATGRWKPPLERITRLARSPALQLGIGSLGKTPRFLPLENRRRLRHSVFFPHICAFRLPLAPAAPRLSTPTEDARSR